MGVVFYILDIYWIKQMIYRFIAKNGKIFKTKKDQEKEDSFIDEKKNKEND